MLTLWDCRYTLVLDTNQYAGNFEQELTAWLTGCEEGLSRGEYEAKVARDEIPSEVYAWLENHVELRMCDDGNSCPCSMTTSPKWVNFGEGLSGPKDTPLEVILPQYMKRYQRRTRQTSDLKMREEEARFRGQYHQGFWPAFNSVAIFLDEEPPPFVLQMMMDRVKTFQPDPVFVSKGLEIFTLRVVKETRTEETLHQCILGS